MIEVSKRVERARDILAKKKENTTELFSLVSPSEKILSLPGECSHWKFVGMELSTFLRRTDIDLLLDVLGYEGRSSYIWGGSVSHKRSGKRTDFGFSRVGPIKETYRSELPRSRVSPLAFVKISPEELAAHIRQPEVFLKDLSASLEEGASAILMRERGRASIRFALARRQQRPV